MPETAARPATDSDMDTNWSPTTEIWISREWAAPSADTFLFEDEARGTFPALNAVADIRAFGGTADLPIFVPPDFLL